MYTSIFWDNVYQELFISDEKGYVTVLNVYQEKPLVHKQIIEDEKIKRKSQDMEAKRKAEEDLEEHFQRRLQAVWNVADAMYYSPHE